MVRQNPGVGRHCIREAVRPDRFCIDFACNGMEPVLAAGGGGPNSVESETSPPPNPGNLTLYHLIGRLVRRSDSMVRTIRPPPSLPRCSMMLSLYDSGKLRTNGLLHSRRHN